MYGDCLNTYVLHALYHFFDIAGVVVPAEAGFDGDRQAGGADTGFGEAYHEIEILKYGGAGAFANHFFYRATEVDIQEIGLCGVDDAGGECHCVFIAAEDLDADGALVVEYIEFLAALDGIADEAFGGDELGVHEIGTVLLADRAEGRVAHVFHGGEEEGEIAELYVTYFHQNGCKGT